MDPPYKSLQQRNRSLGDHDLETMAAKVDDGIEILSCNYDRNDVNLALTAAKDGAIPASGVTAPERHSVSTKTTSTMSTPVPSASPTPTPPSVNTIPERGSRKGRRSEGSVKVRGDHYRGDHYRVANQEEYDEETEAENGRMTRVDGSVAVKTPEDFEEDDNENNPYRKKVARVVVVISVVMLVMSILLVCVSLNMSKNIDDLVRINNDRLRKPYVHDADDISSEQELNSTEITSNTTMA